MHLRTAHLRTALFAFAVVFAIAAVPAPVEAAPTFCSCEYCSDNPQQWCSFMGYTNTCNLFLNLWCEGGGFLTAPTGLEPVAVDATAGLCQVSEDDAQAQDDAPEPVAEPLPAAVEAEVVSVEGA